MIWYFGEELLYLCQISKNLKTMLAKIVYVLGIVVAVWCVLDIFKKPSLGIIGKILLSIAVLAFSWVGFIVYYFLLRNRV